MRMIKTDTDVITTLDELADSTKDTQTKVDLRNASRSFAMHHDDCNNKWHLPSIIVGALGGVALGLLLFAPDVNADSFDVNLASTHGDRTYDYNENSNFGLGYTYDVPKNTVFGKHLQLMGGFYDNSYDKLSTYGLAHIKHDMNGWQWGIAAGFVTGYDDIEVQDPMQSKFSGKKKIDRERDYYEDEHHEADPKYKVKDAPHSHPKNLDAIQFMAGMTLTWKVTKQNHIMAFIVPAFTATHNSPYEFIAINYKRRF